MAGSLGEEVGMVKLKETDLAAQLIPWLEAQHWEVWQEIQFRTYAKIADIVAVRNNYLWIIETKTSLSLTVMRQAHEWRCHFRSIAVPRGRNLTDRKFAYRIAYKYLKLGILEIGRGNYGDVNEIESPPLLREFHRFSIDKINQLDNYPKALNKAGSDRGGYFTPYKHTMMYVRSFIEENPGCTLKQIIDDLDGKYHYSNNQSAKGSIRKALEVWEDWCRVEREGKEYKYFIKGDNN